MGRRPGGVHEGRRPLKLLDGLFVLFVGGDAGHAAGDDFNAPQVPPLGGEDLVQGVRQFHGVAGEGGIPDAQFADLGEGRLEGRQQFGFQLAVQLGALVVLTDVAADVGIEQQGVGDLIAVGAEALDAHVHVDAGPLVHHPEGHGAGGAVLVIQNFLGVEIVHPLVLGGFAAEGEPPADVAEDPADALAQATCKNAGLRGGVVDELARLGTDFRHLALVHDEHALAVCHGDDGAGGDDVLVALGVAGPLGDLLPSLYRQGVRREGFTVKIFLPLVGQYAAGRTGCRFDKSHVSDLLSDVQVCCGHYTVSRPRMPEENTKKGAPRRSFLGWLLISGGTGPPGRPFSRRAGTGCPAGCSRWRQWCPGAWPRPAAPRRE